MVGLGRTRRVLRFFAGAALTLGVIGALAMPASAASAPGSPSNPIATPGDGTVSLRWGAAPANWSTVTSYVVPPVADGVPGPPLTFPGSVTTQLLGGLTNGVSYTFRIVAVNAVGTGRTAETAAVVPG